MRLVTTEGVLITLCNGTRLPHLYYSVPSWTDEALRPALEAVFKPLSGEERRALVESCEGYLRLDTEPELRTVFERLTALRGVYVLGCTGGGVLLRPAMHERLPR